MSAERAGADAAGLDDPRHLSGLDLPYRTPELPGIGGRLKADPRDFRVTEIPAYAPTGTGPHLYVNLSRAGYDTPDIARRLARSLGTAPADVGYAGLKDKESYATQTFSVRIPEDASGAPDAQRAALEAALPVQVHWVSRHRNRLKPGHLRGNAFEILIRDPALPVAQAATGAARIGARLAAIGMANFFGPQRFGRAGHNVRQGWRMLRAEFREPRAWLRKLYLSAYQSYLCNQYLARRQRAGYLDRMVAGDVARKRATGGMFLVTDPERDTERLQAGEISFTAPMFGHKMWQPEGEAGRWEAGLAAEAAVTAQDWRRQRVKGTRRTGRLWMTEVEITETAVGVRCAFSLPKGSYATTLLREIMKNDG